MKGFKHLFAHFEVEKRLAACQIDKYRKARNDLAAEVEAIVHDAKVGSGRPIQRSARYQTGMAMAVVNGAPPIPRRIIPARPRPARQFYGAC